MPEIIIILLFEEDGISLRTALALQASKGVFRIVENHLPSNQACVFTTTSCPDKMNLIAHTWHNSHTNRVLVHAQQFLCKDRVKNSVTDSLT
jgi:hypothetical protein